MKTQKIKVASSIKNHKIRYEKVDGKLVGDHLGAYYHVGKGYRIIHIPTGFLVTYASFLNITDAERFAEITQQTFGDLLAAPTISVIQDNLHVPGGKEFNQLRLRLESLDRPITIKDINGFIYRSIHSNTIKGVRIGGKNTPPASIS